MFNMNIKTNNENNDISLYINININIHDDIESIIANEVGFSTEVEIPVARKDYITWAGKASTVACLKALGAKGFQRKGFKESSLKGKGSKSIINDQSKLKGLIEPKIRQTTQAIFWIFLVVKYIVAFLWVSIIPESLI